MSPVQPASPRSSAMTRREKMIRVLKIAVCILSFGFIFPNINLD